MVLHAVKKIPKATWTNDRDAFYASAAGRDAPPYRDCDGRARPLDAPTGLPSEFVTDCVVWSAFADSNYAVALRNVEYQGRTWQIANNLFPFLLEEVRRWPCGHGDIAAQLAAANEDRFLARWLAGHDIGIGNNLNNGKNNFEFDPGATAPGDKAAALVGAAEKEKVVFTSCSSCFQTNLSPEARAVLAAARALYREFYANICHSPWMEWKIETWDVGYYQIRNAMKTLGGSRSCATDGAADAQERVPPAEALRVAHDALRAKLLPQIYSLGFLNPDVEYFT